MNVKVFELKLKFLQSLCIFFFCYVVNVSVNLVYEYLNR